MGRGSLRVEQGVKAFEKTALDTHLLSLVR